MSRRLFVAVSPGEQFRRELTTRLAPWRERLPVRWTRPETWHLTLSFLGEWPPERQDALQDALHGAIATGPFLLRPGGLDGFPHLRSPRVLFVQMAGDGQLERLAGQVRDAVDRTWPEGPQDRRPLRPHLTLARTRERISPGQVNLLQQIDLSGLPEVFVERVHLVRSERLPEGPRYTDQAVFGLRKKGE